MLNERCLTTAEQGSYSKCSSESRTPNSRGTFAAPKWSCGKGWLVKVFPPRRASFCALCISSSTFLAQALSQHSPWHKSTTNTESTLWEQDGVHPTYGEMGKVFIFSMSPKADWTSRQPGKLSVITSLLVLWCGQENMLHIYRSNRFRKSQCLVAVVIFKAQMWSWA